MANALPFILQHDRVAWQASDVPAADWQYQMHEKLFYFSHLLSGLSQGWESFYNTAVYMIKDFTNLKCQQDSSCEDHCRTASVSWCLYCFQEKLP